VWRGAIRLGATRICPLAGPEAVTTGGESSARSLPGDGPSMMSPGLPALRGRVTRSAAERHPSALSDGLNTHFAGSARLRLEPKTVIIWRAFVRGCSGEMTPGSFQGRRRPGWAPLCATATLRSAHVPGVAWRAGRLSATHCDRLTSVPGYGMSKRWRIPVSPVATQSAPGVVARALTRLTMVSGSIVSVTS
jgi:hypothetical protein